MAVRIGILGFGLIGQYIIQRLLDSEHPQYIGNVASLEFVWNRTIAKLSDAPSCIGCSIPSSCILENLDEMEGKFPNVDVIVEVAHPGIYKLYGERLLRHASVYVGSPTAFADEAVFQAMRLLACAPDATNALYFPSGALWGGTDVLKMGSMRLLGSVSITMRKPPHSFRLEEPLQSDLSEYLRALEDGTAGPELVLYRGPVRALCPMAPNNVNTMACLAIASGLDIGFDGCIGELIADSRVAAHIIDISVKGKPIPGRDDVFEVTTRRFNPCDPHQVTASATYPSFLSSLKNIIAKGDGVKRLGGIHFV